MTQDLIQAEVLLQEDFPAKTSQSLAKGLVLLVKEAGFSGTLQDLWKKRKANGSSSKTCLVCLPLTEEKTLQSFSGKWPNSGIVLPGGSLMLNTSEFPREGAEYSSLADVLEVQVQPKYYLSLKAAEGVLRRSNRNGNKLPDTLQKAFEDVVYKEQKSAE